MTSTSVPLVMTEAGPQPTPPATLNADLIALVAASQPGYTANLPLSLIEDVSSTCTGALALMDQARVDTINSLTPYGANAYLLNQLGQVYGVAQGTQSNTSVSVVFSGPPGYIIPRGFVVTDGTYQYVVQDGGVIASFGQSSLLFCVANVAGTWAVPENTVTGIATSVPTGFALTVFNPFAGTPGSAAQTVQSYQSEVLQAGLAGAQGFAKFLRTQLGKIPGVQQRLVSPRRAADGNWEIIVGGGEAYQIAYAIYTSLFDFFNIVGSTLNVIGISQANPGVVTTSTDHYLTDGQTIVLEGVVGMTPVNGVALTVSVTSLTTFSIGVDTTGYPAYVSGGVVTPNPRDVTVTITDYPDVYSITYVNPPQQVVGVSVVWGTTSTNAVSNSAMQAAAAPALADYVNSVIVGQPMNLFELQATFQAATASILPTAQLTRLVFTVTIDGTVVLPVTGTGIIEGDPEAYFETITTQISVTQG